MGGVTSGGGKAGRGDRVRRPGAHSALLAAGHGRWLSRDAGTDNQRSNRLGPANLVRGQTSRVGVDRDISDTAKRLYRVDVNAYAGLPRETDDVEDRLHDAGLRVDCLNRQELDAAFGESARDILAVDRAVRPHSYPPHACATLLLERLGDARHRGVRQPARSEDTPTF